MTIPPTRSPTESPAAPVVALIPAFNAQPWLGNVVRRTLQQVPHVTVVDDGSRDQTASIAAEAGAEVIRRASNGGKGQALHDGFETLLPRGHQAIVTLDADGQHLPEEIPKLITTWQNGADLVLGTREHLFAEMSRLRRFGNSMGSRTISLFIGQSIHDIQTGFRLYSVPLLQSTGFPESGFEAESAVLVRALRRRFKVATQAIYLGQADGTKSSHFRPLIDTLRIARAVARARLERLP